MRIVNIDSVNLKRPIPRRHSDSDVVYAVYEKGWKDALAYVENSAVEVPGKKTAKWVSMDTPEHNYTDRYECSNCGFISAKIVSVGGHIIDQLSDYCPDCGADMREMDE